MAKPTTLPLWNTAEERVLEPSVTQQATGWIWTGSKFEKPKGETLNHWMNNVYKWTKYFNDEIGSDYVNKTTTYTAVDGDKLWANTSGGAFTISLPATPLANYFVVVSNQDSTNTLTVSGNGENLNLRDVVDTTLEINTVLELIFRYNGTYWEVN